MIKRNWKSEYSNIQKMYEKGISISEIGKIYKTTYDSIRSIIKNQIGLKLSTRKNWINNYKNIQNLYKLGMSSGDIAKLFHTSRNNIGRIIDNTIGRRNSSEARKLCVNQGKHKNFFIAASKINRQKENSPLWITDRSKLKNTRCFTEERWFFKEVLEERKYTCELTKKVGGKLSVHHIIPVWKNKKLQFIKSNVIVILQLIHKQFHRMYGLKGDENDWKCFIEEQQYSI